MVESVPHNRNEEAVTLEIRQVLARLKLNQPAYVRLVPESKLVALVEWQLEQAETGAVGDLAYRAICRCIYEACTAEDRNLQELAYQWLGTYLYLNLLHKLNGNREQAEDLTNNALIIVFRKIADCRQPEFFLKWAAQIAAREFLQLLRKQPKAEDRKVLQQVQQNLEFKPQDLEATLADRSIEPENIVLNRERLQEIVNRIEKFRHTKRAGFYKKILYGTYFLGLDDSELASRLNISVKEVQKRRFQALSALRTDRDWIDKIR